MFFPSVGVGAERFAFSESAARDATRNELASELRDSSGGKQGEYLVINRYTTRRCENAVMCEERLSQYHTHALMEH